jgi:hypothetical protein
MFSGYFKKGKRVADVIAKISFFEKLKHSFMVLIEKSSFFGEL